MPKRPTWVTKMRKVYELYQCINGLVTDRHQASTQGNTIGSGGDWGKWNRSKEDSHHSTSVIASIQWEAIFPRIPVSQEPQMHIFFPWKVFKTMAINLNFKIAGRTKHTQHAQLCEHFLMTQSTDICWLIYTSHCVRWRGANFVFKVSLVLE